MQTKSNEQSTRALDLDAVAHRSKLPELARVDPVAYARLILRRAGIAPLVCGLVAANFSASPAPAAAENTSTVRATALAQARVVVLPSSARISDGVLQQANGNRTSAGGQAGRVSDGVSVAVRPCDPAPGQRAGEPVLGACRMTIYNLP